MWISWTPGGQKLKPVRDITHIYHISYISATHEKARFNFPLRNGTRNTFRQRSCKRTPGNGTGNGTGTGFPKLLPGTFPERHRECPSLVLVNNVTVGDAHGLGSEKKRQNPVGVGSRPFLPMRAFDQGSCGVVATPGRWSARRLVSCVLSLVVRDSPPSLGPPGLLCRAVVYGLRFSRAGLPPGAPAFLAAVRAEFRGGLSASLCGAYSTAPNAKCL